MFPFRPPLRSTFDPILINDPVYLRRPVMRDYESWLHLRTTSRAHLTQWEQNWIESDVSAAKFRERLRLFDRTAKNARGLSLFVFQEKDDTLVGGLTLTNIRYGAARAGTLGYWVGEPFLRKGFGAAAVTALLPYVFETLELNRVEAACQSENSASIGLLTHVGFEHEGRAKEYLRINGTWRDHDLYGMTASAFAKRKL